MTVPPDGQWVFEVEYLPLAVGQDTAKAIICSNAANTTASSHVCTLEDMSPLEINLCANAIDPRLYIEPSAGRMDITGVLVSETYTDYFTIKNVGTGNILIDSIVLGAGTPGFEIVNVAPAGAENGYTLTNDFMNDVITVTFQYAPPYSGTLFRSVVINHNDKKATKPGLDPGQEYPAYNFELWGFSSENTNPFAIAKSPVGVPAGPYGSRQTTVNVGMSFPLDGSASYDIDEDDFIVGYLWESDSPNVSITSPTDAVTTAVITDNGQYEIVLRVKDSRDAWSSGANDPVPMDARLLVKALEEPIAVDYACDDYATFIQTQPGVEICLDGSASTDANGGPVSGYSWFLRERGSTQSFNFAVSSTARYTFTTEQVGRWEAYLVVTDADGTPSTNNPVIDIEVKQNEGLYVIANWTGGDVNIHYMPPGGSLYHPVLDCNEDNPSPDWGNYGHPQCTGSEIGFVGETITHNDPGDGSYTIVAEYVTHAFHTELREETRRFEDDCARCGCEDDWACGIDCDWLSGTFGCCRTCNVTSTFPVEVPDPTEVTFRITAGSRNCFKQLTLQPSASGAPTTSQFNLQRGDGEWICP